MDKSKVFRSACWLLAILSVLLLLTPGIRVSATSTTVTFSNFADLSPLQLSGSTAAIANPIFFNGKHVLRLTNNLSQAGGAFLKDPIQLTDGSGFRASFSTAFEFQITNPMGCIDTDGVQGADGIVFVVQTQSNQYGGPGVGIGYQGIPNSLGIEFDTWNNGVIDGNNGNHIGVNLNGNIHSVARADIHEAPMNNGQVWYAWVDYDGDAQLIEVRLSQTSTRPAAPTLVYSVDLPAVLGQPNAYVGFTSGTGCAGGFHDIRAWQFTNTHAPIENVCEPVSGLTWVAPLSGSTEIPHSATDPLPIRFRWNNCDLDASVSIRVRNTVTNQLYTGYTYGSQISFGSDGVYQQTFRPADYGIAPGQRLKVMVYFGGRLRGTAYVSVQ